MSQSVINRISGEKNKVKTVYVNLCASCFDSLVRSRFKGVEATPMTGWTVDATCEHCNRFSFAAFIKLVDKGE